MSYVPMSRQPPPVPVPFTFEATPLPDGMTLVDDEDDGYEIGGIVHQTVLIGGKPYERRFNTATGNSELTPLF